MQIRIQAGSALVGAGVLALSLLAASSSQEALGLVNVSRLDRIKVVGIPDPRGALVIREGTDYIVPPGKLFVLTAMGLSQFSGGSPSFIVDGNDELRVDGSAGIVSIPTGVTVASGSTISVNNGVGRGRAWGYLVDA